LAGAILYQLKIEEMFTIQQIKDAHSKVKSGADFPAYIRDIKKLGVASYETFVAGGHSVYYDGGGGVLVSEPKYAVLAVEAVADADQFKKDLVRHQQGGSDYMQFCRDCAGGGVEKWVVRLDEMTCTYYDRAGNELLVEAIPG
jgi:uncharacterized protein YbcV (DUF1398 family)